jgi:putative membrane protein
MAELVVVWGWHAPAARAWAESSILATVLEQSSFLAVGLALWTSCLAAGSAGSSAHRGAGAFGLLLTSVHMTLLGALLALSSRPLYGTAIVTCFGTTLEAGQDQQLGAVIMLMVGAVAYLVGGLVLLWRLLELPERGRA